MFWRVEHSEIWLIDMIRMAFCYRFCCVYSQVMQHDTLVQPAKSMQPSLHCIVSPENTNRPFSVLT
jgi:hypothetical protein